MSSSQKGTGGLARRIPNYSRFIVGVPVLGLLAGSVTLTIIAVDPSLGPYMGNLRVLLSTLHKSLGESLTISRDAVALNPEAQIWMDTTQLENCLNEVHQQGQVTTETARQVEQALDLYKGDFLEGFSVTDCQRFENWRTRERSNRSTIRKSGR